MLKLAEPSWETTGLQPSLLPTDWEYRVRMIDASNWVAEERELGSIWTVVSRYGSRSWSSADGAEGAIRARVAERKAKWEFHRMQSQTERTYDAEGNRTN
jgi:hypothetical protein